MTVMPESAADAAIRKLHGDRIRAARGDRSQQAIADAMVSAGHATTPQSISQWENGERTPRPAAARALADVLGVPWSDLFDPTGAVA